MAIHRKPLGVFRGLYPSANEIAKDMTFATIAKNLIHTRRGGISCRPGQKPTMALTSSYLGLIEFPDRDITTGEISFRKLLLDASSNNLKEIVDGVTITVSNSSGADVIVSLGPDASDSNLHKFRILSSSGSVLFTKTLQNGSGSPNVSCSTLQSDLLAAGINVTISTIDGTSSINAAYLENTYETLSSGSTTTLSAFTTSTISGPNFFSIYSTGNGSRTVGDTFELPVTTLINDVLYISSTERPLIKFDGNSLMSAVAVKPGDIAITTSGTAGNLQGDYSYIATHQIIDQKNNSIEGLPCPIDDVTNASFGGTSQTVKIILPTTYDSPTAYSSTDYNVVASRIDGGSQNLATSLTLTVDSGHGVVAGNLIHLRQSDSDGSFKALISARVESVTTTTITLYSPTVHPFTIQHKNGNIDTIDYVHTSMSTTIFQDNDVFSTGYLINIYRTENLSGASVTNDTTFYLVDIVPGGISPDAADPNPYVIDNRADSDLVVEYEPKTSDALTDSQQIDKEGLPPIGKYNLAYKDKLYIAGVESEPNTLFSSDILYGPEWFWADGRDSLDMSTQISDNISGLGATSEMFYVFKDSSIRIIDGLIGTEQQRVYTIDNEIGCVAHASICPYSGNRLAFVSKRGIMLTNVAGAPVPIDGVEGTRVRSELFTEDLEFRKCRVTNDTLNKRLYIYIPVRDIGTSLVANPPSDNLMLVYDYLNDSWAKFSGINALGGMFVSREDGRLYTNSIEQGTSTSVSRVSRSLNKGNVGDYADWNAPISWELATVWDDMGEPGVNKKWLRVGLERSEPSSIEHNAPTISISVEKDWIEDSSVSSTSVSMSATNNKPIARIKPIKSESVRIRFSSNSYNQCPVINNYVIEAVSPYETVLKK